MKRIFSFIIKMQYFNLTSLVKSVFIFIILSSKLTIGANAEAATDSKIQFCLKAPKFGWMPNEFFDIETRNEKIILRSKKYDCEIVYENLDPILY